MMKTLVIANQKGGVGKTATLVHLAFDLAERGKKVAVIDLDTQGNASFTLAAYRSEVIASSLFGGMSEFDLAPIGDNIAVIVADAGLAEIEKLELEEAGAAFGQCIATIAANGFDYCLIDTAPSLGNAMISALLSADFVASPIEVEEYAFQGIRKMQNTVAAVRKANAKLNNLGMIPTKVDGRNPRHERNLAELTAAHPSQVMPVSIGYRSSIADALATHVPVWEIRKTSARVAAKEMRALAQHIYEMMESA